MLDYLDTDRCRMWFLRDQLDDPDGPRPTRCGRCDNCGGLALSAVGLRRRPSTRPRTRLARPGVVVEPRKMWPTALANLGLDLKGRIGDGRRAGPGGGPAHRPRPRPGAARAVRRAAPDERGARGVWCAPSSRCSHDWRPQVDGIVVVESATRPDPDRRPGRRAVALPRGSRSSAAGRSPTRPSQPGPGRDELRPARRGGRPALPARGRRARPARCCSSTTRSVTGWTLTLAAKALREAGATRCCRWCWPPDQGTTGCPCRRR